MPRRHPQRPVRLDGTLPGASRRLQAALARSGIGSVTSSYLVWSKFVHDPRHRALWYDDAAYLTEHRYGLEDPERAREWLERAICTLPRRSSRELRKLVDRLDDLF